MFALPFDLLLIYGRRYFFLVNCHSRVIFYFIVVVDGGVFIFVVGEKTQGY